MEKNKIKAQTVSVQKDDQLYTILYGLHVRSQDPSDLPEGTDGVFLETGIHDYLDSPDQTIALFKTHVQYKELITHAENHRIPLIFGDLKYRYNDLVLLLLDNVLSVVEWNIGQKLLKRGIKGKRNSLLLGTWFVMPIVTSFIRLFSSVTGKGNEMSGRLKRLSHTFHPETEILYLSLRNAIIAEKMEYITQYAGKISHFTAVLGAGHVGIEDMLLSSEKRTETLQKLKPVLRKLARKEYVYSLIVMTYSDKEWRVEKRVEVPELKQLVQ